MGMGMRWDETGWDGDGDEMRMRVGMGKEK